MADSSYLTIGKVVKKLQPRYPDLTVSKVRFLEDEGLLEPSRTPGGYRLYAPADIERLETILYLQKEHFRPLSVIKDLLEGKAQEEEETADGSAGEEAETTASSSVFPPAAQADILSELARQDSPDILEKLHPIERVPELTDAPVGFVRQLADIGLIELKRSPHGRDLVEGRDLALVRAALRLRRYGIEPRNLRQYVLAANRESTMVEQALMPEAHRNFPDETQKAHDLNESFETIVSYTNALRVAIIRRNVTQGIPEIHL